jgi:hypothetical protein
MAVLVPAIHGVPRVPVNDVDARDKPGHDGGERLAPQLCPGVIGPGLRREDGVEGSRDRNSS